MGTSEDVEDQTIFSASMRCSGMAVKREEAVDKTGKVGNTTSSSSTIEEEEAVVARPEDEKMDEVVSATGGTRGGGAAAILPQDYLDDLKKLAETKDTRRTRSGTERRRSVVEEPVGESNLISEEIDVDDWISAHNNGMARQRAQQHPNNNKGTSDEKATTTTTTTTKKNINNTAELPDLVTLTRDELQALIDSRVKQERTEREFLMNRERREMEALLKREREERREEMKALQTTVMKTLLLNQHGRFDAENEHDNNIELTELQDNVGGMAPPEAWKEDDQWRDNNNKGCSNNDDNKIIAKHGWHAPFGESVYTLMYLCAFQSQGFWYSAVVYCIQILTISLVLADTLDTDSDTNPLQIPPMVPPAVTYAQGVTIVLLLAYQSRSDLVEGVLKLQDGFYPEILEEYPGATFSTWLTSCLAQLAAGLLVLLGSFLLTLQASSVIDLMLNLTALLFILEIDDLGFYLAKKGFVTDELQAVTTAAEDFQVPKRKRRNIYRRVLYLLTMMGLFVGFSILKDRQLSGYYLPTNVYAQFGDAYNPRIPHYSGILVAVYSTTAAHREYRDMGTSNILLAYCKAERAWTFSEGGIAASPCRGFFAKSYETTTYDVTSIPDSEWQVMDSNGRFQPFDSFSLVDRDCDSNTCQGTCGTNGLCQCPHDKFGMDCEFVDVCNEIVIDDRFPGFPQVVADNAERPGETVHETFSEKFHLLQHHVTKEYIRIYSMPVYYSNSTFPANVMFFGGRRWILTTEHVLVNLTKAWEENPNRRYFPEKTVEALVNDNFLRAHYDAKYTPYLVSDPVDFETPNFQPTPVGIRWWTVKTGNETLQHFSPDVQVDTLLLCQKSAPSCLDQPESYCGWTGYCNNETGLCDCYDYYGIFHGDRCEVVLPCYEHYIPCSNRGTCDQATGICQCQAPWHGDGCWSPYRCYEEDGGCNDGGICNSTSGYCSCPVDPAVSGVSCERRASCEFFGCANGGVCGYNGQCICRPPYYGTHCDRVNKTQQQEEFFCFGDKDCANNGTCNLETGFCDCATAAADPTAYGPLCENRFNCSHNDKRRIGHVEPDVGGGGPCLNSGMCNESTGICECPEPYFGPDCSQSPPCLQDEDCWGPYELDWWGTCDVDSGLCQCYYGRIDGLRCEKDTSYLTGCVGDEDCYGESTCYRGTCQCTDGRGGYRCESYLVGEYLASWDTYQTDLEESVQHCGFEDPFCCFSNVTELATMFYDMCY